MNFLDNSIKNFFAIFTSATILAGTVSAMNIMGNNDFLEFKKNSVFNQYTICDFTDTKMSHFENKDIYIHLIAKSYNMFKYYIEEMPCLKLQKNIKRSTIEDLIKYIRNYEFDNTFKSITEILHLTVECIVNGCANKVIDLSKMGFDFARFKSDILTMTFENFKMCMIDRLEDLIYNHYSK